MAMRETNEFQAQLHQVLFVYDIESGEVLEEHHVSTVGGGDPPEYSELEREVSNDASTRLQRQKTKLGVESLTAEDYDQDSAYRFDIDSNRLIAVRTEKMPPNRIGLPDVLTEFEATHRRNAE